MNISLVIFCYNERDNLESVIQSCIRVLDRIAISYEVIIVDDGSNDGTAEVIDSFINSSCNLKVIRHEDNKGIGMALRTGYAACSKEFVCAIPGDGQFDVDELLNIKPFLTKSFYSFCRPKTNYNLYRNFLNQSNRIFNRLLLGLNLKDVNWIKVYRRDQLEFVDMELKSSILESEICAKLMKAGCTPVELPSVYRERKSGDAKGGNWKTLNLALQEMFSLYLVVRKFKKQI